MKILNRFILWPLFILSSIVGLFVVINLIILIYGLLQEYPAAQFSTLFLLLVAGFGTDHWRKRKINNRIPNPYKQN